MSAAARGLRCPHDQCRICRIWRRHRSRHLGRSVEHIEAGERGRHVGHLSIHIGACRSRQCPRELVVKSRCLRHQALELLGISAKQFHDGRRNLVGGRCQQTGCRTCRRSCGRVDCRAHPRQLRSCDYQRLRLRNHVGHRCTLTPASAQHRRMIASVARRVSVALRRYGLRAGDALLPGWPSPQRSRPGTHAVLRQLKLPAPHAKATSPRPPDHLWHLTMPPADAERAASCAPRQSRT